MVKVVIWGSLRSVTGGAAEVVVEATNFKGVVTQLEKDFPGLKPQIERGVSLAIDGMIYRESWLTPIRPDSEVVLIPYMAGG